MEQEIQSDDGVLKFFCSYCEELSSGPVRCSKDTWVDLRGEVGCQTCGLSNRERLFYDAIKHSNLSISQGKGLIFEKITNLYSRLQSKLDIVGVEFGGYDLKSGVEFHHLGQKLEHQNMESISYGDCTFDYDLHCDVLEHVNDPIKAVKENIRVLKKGGIALFTTPIYTGQRGSITTASLGKNNRVIFHGEELYHGDPLRGEGVPVFTLFGLDFIADLQASGIVCSYLIEHSLLRGIFSNNNPYDVGHMWPIVIKIQKNG